MGYTDFTSIQDFFGQPEVFKLEMLAVFLFQFGPRVVIVGESGNSGGGHRYPLIGQGLNQIFHTRAVAQYHHGVCGVAGQTSTQFADVNLPSREVEIIDFGDGDWRCLEGFETLIHKFRGHRRAYGRRMKNVLWDEVLVEQPASHPDGVAEASFV